MSRRRLVEHVPLLLWTVPLAALMVGAILAMVEIDKDWAVVLACVALVATALAMAVVTRSFLSDEEGGEPEARRASVRWPVRGGSLQAVHDLS
jgi:positive regulator of sigma E activity